GHLRQMTTAEELGAIVFLPVHDIDHLPQIVMDIFDQTVYSVLDQFDIQLEDELFTSWQGEKP
ncbi:3-octaprenyl-4-hydroxybenzoate carboxy-lyase, partial [Erwinia amylovora]|nr:3-octaprenyl-4-hydroxybenzoate carboxy-lyase [Erwinia amylovora]